MHALMQERQLLIPDILAHAAAYHRGARIVSVRADGTRVAHGYPAIAERAARLAGALLARGVRPGERIATLAWNDHRHLEAYYAIPGIGAVCHTVNPRLFPEQVAFILREGGATHLLVDPQFLPLVGAIAGRLGPALRTLVVMADAVPPGAGIPELETIGYEALVAAASPLRDWPRFPEGTAASLCYTSGTTGEPKGVLYSHRSTVLHAMAVNLPDAFGLRATDVLMPAVPMFHVHAWGLPYAAPMVGASLVLPGPRLDGASLQALIEGEGVTQAAGVPTVWLNLLARLRATGATLSRPLRLVIGGSACPPALARELEGHGATVSHAWGMTELSPLGTFNAPKPEDAGEDAGEAARHRRQAKQGRPGFGVALRIVDEAGAEVPADGASFGELMAAGPWVASGYFGRDGDPAFRDGWFRTGDVATMDASGTIEIVDRAKDVIKSGGEWISSIALEAIAASHPGVAEAAAIPARHPVWGERPLLLVVAAEGRPPVREEVLAHFHGKVAGWWVPDDVVFVDALPRTATGKLAKVELKARYAEALIGSDTPQVPQKVR